MIIMMEKQLKKKHIDLLQKYYTVISPDAQIVYDSDGKPIQDKGLEDWEIIPFRYEGGIDGFLKNEILPYTTDAWIERKSI